ncbi:MAG: DUF1592 domain-containing protein [Planctomycetota bacterium]|nr:DUF1592 domain-containing protein [Planctomycetota bacterium]MDA1252298.1 DUF1592 domain-containing protein [Planctomycetota bacterium]
MLLFIGLMGQSLFAADVTASLGALLKNNCLDCHDGESAEGGLDLTLLEFNLDERRLRDRWILIHDRVKAGEMPPDRAALADGDRQSMVKALHEAIATADRADVLANGRGPLRRLNRDEYQQNLRDVLQLPLLDIRDMLPEDREAHRFNKTASALDMSRVQLAAYLDAAGVALQQAMASGPEPPPVTRYRAASTQLFSATNTFGEREAMFFAKDNKAVDTKDLAALKDDPALELALFRSAHWPYYGYPRGFVAKLPGEYRVRFSARAVLQTEGYQLKPATEPVPMTFRARKPSGPDVSGDVRATGGIMDIQPEARIYETIIRLLPTETFEYSLLGLPVPLARNVDGGPPTYRYPPFPKGGQPGIAFEWLEVEGPNAPESWPPPSHRVLFHDLGADVQSTNPQADARRLLRRFAKLAAREPVPDEALLRFEQLILKRLEQGSPFPEAMLAGYKAFLCSSHFLYLREPSDPATSDLDHYAIASRLSHLLTNTRPDAALLDLAAAGKLRDANTLRNETDRLIDSPGFDRFVQNFTDYWLSLRHIRRDEPDIRLHPEYRFDDYLVESMERETRTFFAAMIRENLRSSVLVEADFAYVNDRLARHYGLDAVFGSKLRKVTLPDDSPYGGLLTQAAILKVTANGTSTSPVIRGAWIMERLIGQPPPPPPTSVPAVEPDIRGAKTIRELLALHTKSESCAGCHAKFDPVGLALENFDILGGWRTRYRSVEAGERITGIDRAGHDFTYALSDAVNASGRLLDGRRFRDIHELKAILADDPRQLARNLLHQFTLYATGTPVRFADRAEIESILDACASDDYRIRDLVHSLVQSRVFPGEEN